MNLRRDQFCSAALLRARGGGGCSLNALQRALTALQFITCLLVQELTQGLPASATKRLAPRFRQIRGGARGFLQTHDQGTLDTISLQLRNTRAYMRKLAALTIGT